MQRKEFGAEIGRVLDLMINALYTNKDIFLRELISNASDACDKLRYESLHNKDFSLSKELNISIEINNNNKTISIMDNGIGMNQNDLIENLGTIANSGTKKFIEQLESGKKPDINQIGQFGVGFYAAFMVADKVEVLSKKVGDDNTYIWRSNGDGNYEVGSSNADLENNGTKITLYLKESQTNYLDKFKLKHIVKTYSDHVSFPITLINDGEEEVVNTASALWTRNKSEISVEQYKDFYQFVSHQPDEPWLTLHNNIEGNISYKSLLFIPSNKPYDLFHPDRRARVKLYIKRVFITDETVKLIPAYLRFLRGVVDSDDLPLNISRESIQNNLVLDKIRKSIVKKVLAELKKCSQKDPVKYVEFWNNYGEVVKEGLCEPSLEEKEEILEICRFNSTDSESLTSLDEYISRMADDQEDIFYLTGEDINKLRSHPRLEGFKKRNIEVLLLPEYVDDFWVNVINQYKGKSLQNASNTSVDLDKIQKMDTDNSNDNVKINEQELIGRFKQELGANIKDVIISKKLIDSPSCLALGEGNMSLRMEKMLIEQKQLKSESAKILEINIKHPIIQKIANSNDKNEYDDLIWLTFDQACILEGEKPKDPTKFVERINQLIS